MNYRAPWVVHTVRTLLAVLLLGMGGSGLYFVLAGNAPQIPGMNETIRAAEAALTVSGIIIAAKVIELLVAVLLLFNYRPAFATLLLAPVTVGIVVYDLMLWTHVPASLIGAGLLLSANIYLGVVYWPKYAPLFRRD